MKRCLQDVVCDISEASSGEAALQLLADGYQADLIFLDLTMDGIGGVETLRRIRLDNQQVPVVIVTADVQARTLETVTQLGCSRIVRKPADKKEVLTVISTFLQPED
jgi:CheY-like chemotaxis protein